jgi:small nuclear ribonucleoprotein
VQLKVDKIPRPFLYSFSSITQLGDKLQLTQVIGSMYFIESCFWISFYDSFKNSQKSRAATSARHEKGSQKTNLSQQVKKPLNSLQKAINKQVSVRLKMELEYRGKMASVDQYMNVILVDATEYSGGNPSANYGKVVIRGNNVLFIKISSDFEP